MWFPFLGVPALSEEQHIADFDHVSVLFVLNIEAKHADTIWRYSSSFPLNCSGSLVKWHQPE